VGQYCPLATTTPTQCAAGSYRGEPGATAQGDCAICIRGNYCPIGSVNPTNCSAGSYRFTTGALAQADCSACLVAQYCPIATTTPIDCPIGTYRSTTGAAALADCAQCTVNNYCPQRSINPTACPPNTASVAGSSSLLNCRCVEGYQCSYTKTITATVTLNSTATDFNADVGGVKTAFIAAVAAAAGVPISKVTILGVAAKTSGRRLLSLFAGPSTDESIVVRAKVHGATHLRELDTHLSRHRVGLHVGHEWVENHVVSVVPE